MKTAKRPASANLLPVITFLTALVVLAAGVLFLREFLIATNLISQGSWLNPALGALDGLSASNWMLPVGIVLIIVALMFLERGVRSRPSKYVHVIEGSDEDAPGLYLTYGNAAKLISQKVQKVDGVLDVKTVVSRKKVVVKVQGTSQGGALNTAITNAVKDAVVGFVPQPKIKVKL